MREKSTYDLVFKSPVRSGYLVPGHITETETGLFILKTQNNRTETDADRLVTVRHGFLRLYNRL
jgi:hypothetical protein